MSVLQTQATLELSAGTCVVPSSLSVWEDGGDNGVWGTLVRMTGEQFVEARYDLDGDSVTMGRSSQSRIVIRDPKISTVHLTLHRCPDTLVVTLRDGSRNGTYVNGRRVVRETPCRLRAGDEIGLVRDVATRVFLASFIFRASYSTSFTQGDSSLSLSRQRTLLSTPSRLPGKEPEVPRVLAWQRGDLIGKGGCGDVHLAINCATGVLIAVKSVSTGGGIDAANINEEIDLLKRLRHRNIVRYLDSRIDPTSQYLHIVMEYVPGGSLLQLLTRFGRFHESVIGNYCRQVLRGLQYLHEAFVIHRDIKAANILVTDTGVVKLSDFGSALSLKRQDATGPDAQTTSTLISGTPQWIAPEVVSHGKVSFASDVWSFGCVVLEMCTAKPPWHEMGWDSHCAALYHIGRTKGGPRLPTPPEVSQNLHDFIDRCLQVNPAERPSTGELQRDAFLTSREHIYRAEFLDAGGGEIQVSDGPQAKRRRLMDGGCAPGRAAHGDAAGVVQLNTFDDLFLTDYSGPATDPPPTTECMAEDVAMEDSGEHVSFLRQLSERRSGTTLLGNTEPAAVAPAAGGGTSPAAKKRSRGDVAQEDAGYAYKGTGLTAAFGAFQPLVKP